VYKGWHWLANSPSVFVRGATLNFIDADSVDLAERSVVGQFTGGNFRLLNRLLAQIERILEINAGKEVTKTVVEAARES
jgi:hypothetical protein